MKAKTKKAAKKAKPRTYWAVEVESQDGKMALYTENEMGDHFDDEKEAQWEADEWNNSADYSAKVVKVAVIS